jgi:hypothetical protein
MTAVTVQNGMNSGAQTAALLEPTKQSPPWLTRSLAALGDGFRPMIPEAAALTTGQRRWVEQAEERLGSHLVPALGAEIGKCVAVLQAQFPAREIDEGTAAARAEGYLMALDGVPLFALREAVKRAMRGEAGLNPSYMPKAPELRALVDRLSLPARAHRVHLRRLLEAEVERTPTPEERARVRDLVENLKASLAAPVEDIRKGQ